MAAEVRDILKEVFRDIEKKQSQLDAARVLEAWPAVIGEAAAQHCRIVHLTKQAIRANVDSSAWLYELNLRKPRIQKEMKRRFHIPEVRFRLGSLV